MLGLGNFQLPESLREKLLSIFEKDDALQAMIHDGSPQLGGILMGRHQKIDGPVSRRRALELLELDPQSEEAERARKALLDIDRLFTLIGQWYIFIESGPPLPTEFMAKAKEYFPDAGELHELLGKNDYRGVDLKLNGSRDSLLGHHRWFSDTVLGIRVDAPYEERQAAVHRLDSLLFHWKEIAEGYNVARRDLPLAREYGYICD